MYQYWNGGQVIDTLTARNAGGGGQRMPDKQNFNSVIDTERLTVRRLTPLWNVNACKDFRTVGQI